MESTVKNVSASPSTGMLIDFSDEEKIPFPQQLMYTAEMDDTFGLFAKKPLSSTWPIANLSSGKNGGDVFSPKIVANNESSDSVFEIPNSNGPPVKSALWGKFGAKKERKDSVLSGISNISSIRNSSVSTVGLNEGFVESTESDLSDGLSPFRNSMCSTTDGGGDSADKENSPRGIMEASPDKNASQLLDLSGFTISEGDPEEIHGNAIEAAQVAVEKKNLVAVDTEQDIFTRVMKRQSLKKVGNEAITRKVQEMFDAASPSKNPQLFVSIPKFRTYTPARKPITSERFCYGTPKRQMPFTSSPSVGDQTALLVNSTQVSFQEPPSTTEDSTSQLEKRSQRIIAHVIPTPIRRNSNSQDSVEQVAATKDSKKGKNITPVRMRLSFSSTSSESEAPSSMKAVKTAVIQPRIHSQIKFPPNAKASTVQRLSGEVKDLQPLKAVHGVGPTKLASAFSAPVYRKFPVPMSTSSPIPSPSKVRQLGTPPRHTKSSLARQNASPRVSMSPSAASHFNNSYSRIPQSPNPGLKPPSVQNSRSVPSGKPSIEPLKDKLQSRPSVQRSVSHGNAESTKTEKVRSGLQRPKEIPSSQLRLKRLAVPKF